MNLHELISEYRVTLIAFNKSKLFKRIIFYPFKLFYMDLDINDRIAETAIFNLLKEFRIIYLALYGKNKTYNPLVSIYESLGYNCLDIYIKHKYVIKFRFNMEETYITIDGKYPDANKVLRDVPEEIEKEIRHFIAEDIYDLLTYFRKL